MMSTVAIQTHRGRRAWHGCFGDEGYGGDPKRRDRPITVNLLKKPLFRSSRAQL